MELQSTQIPRREDLSAKLKIKKPQKDLKEVFSFPFEILILINRYNEKKHQGHT